MNNPRNRENGLLALGRRDADRELYRERQNKRQKARDKHENPPVWAYQVPNKRQK